MNTVPKGGRFRMKSSPGQQPKFMLLGMEGLHTRHVRRHQGNGGVEDAVIEGGEIALLNEHGTDFLESQRMARSCVHSRAFVTLPSPGRQCCREVSETFGEPIAAGEDQPALFEVEEAGFQRRVCSRLRLLLGISGMLVTAADLLAQFLKHA